jgi:hypothetical protein
MLGSTPARDPRFEKWCKKNTTGKIAKCNQKLDGDLPHNKLMAEPGGKSQKEDIRSNWKESDRTATHDSKVKSVKFDSNNEMSDFSQVIQKRVPEKKKPSPRKRRMTIERSALLSARKYHELKKASSSNSTGTRVGAIGTFSTMRTTRSGDSPKRKFRRGHRGHSQWPSGPKAKSHRKPSDIDERNLAEDFKEEYDLDEINQVVMQLFHEKDKLDYFTTKFNLSNLEQIFKAVIVEKERLLKYFKRFTRFLMLGRDSLNQKIFEINLDKLDFTTKRDETALLLKYRFLIEEVLERDETLMKKKSEINNILKTNAGVKRPKTGQGKKMMDVPRGWTPVSPPKKGKNWSESYKEREVHCGMGRCKLRQVQSA